MQDGALALTRAAGVGGELVPGEVFTDVGVHPSQAEGRSPLGAVLKGVVLGGLPVGRVEDRRLGFVGGGGQLGEGIGRGVQEHRGRAHEPGLAAGGEEEQRQQQAPAKVMAAETESKGAEGAAGTGGRQKHHGVDETFGR